MEKYGIIQAVWTDNFGRKHTVWLDSFKPVGEIDAIAQKLHEAQKAVDSIKSDLRAEIHRSVTGRIK